MLILFYITSLTLYINYQLSWKGKFLNNFSKRLELNLRLSYYVFNNKNRREELHMKTLKQLREERGYRYKDVAEAIGITEVYYWYIENGQRRPYYDLIVKIADFFKVKLDEIKIF